MLLWTDFVGVTGGALILWWLVFVQIRMEEREDTTWGLTASIIPILSHIWFSVKHWRQVPGTLIVMVIGVVLLAIGLHWQR